MRSKEELLVIAEGVSEDIINSWFYDYSTWQFVAEEEELTDEELDFIQDNIKVLVSVKFKKEK